jgi:Na+-transporting NADH:ubiquinone oxidoreductase subunit C
MAENKETVTRTITVAFMVCLVCAIVVSSAAVLLRPVQETNKTLDRQINILSAAGMYEPGMSAQAVRDTFERIERRFVDLDTGEYVDMPDSYDMREAAKDPELSENLSVEEDPASIKRQAKVGEVYLARDEDGNLTRIILPVHGYGLWSTLYGFLALEPDANTVSGLGFYEHGETPGLGGKVDSESWKAKWPGKKLYGEDGDVAIQVIKGQVEKNTPDKEHKVDGLSGATLTTKGVDNLIRFWVGERGFGPYLDRMADSSVQQTASI